MGIFEIIEIQRSFMNHYGVDSPKNLNVPDGDYIVPVYDQDFNVRLKEGRIYLIPGAELDVSGIEFDATKATRICPHKE